QIGECSAHRLTRSERDLDLLFRVLGIEHQLLKFQALMSRGDSRKIAGGRVTIRTSPGTVEVLLAGLSIARRQLGRIDAFASSLGAWASSGHCILPLRVNERDQCGNLVIRAVKWRHPLFETAVSHDRPDLVAIHVGCDQLGARQIRTAFTTCGVTSMTK